MEHSNGHTTNLQKWRYFCDGLSSPDSFINFGFYSMILSALQRRVFCPPTHKPIFANEFINLVAPPGIGKGLVITEVSKKLKHHKLGNPDEQKQIIGATMDVDRQVVEEVAKANYLAGKSEEDRISGKKSSYEKPLLIPVAADATTYEALVTAIARALRSKVYGIPQPDGTIKKGIYTHSSITFCLEEMSSLFRKKTEDVVNFLLIAYDCGDYKKDTKTQCVDRIQRCCVNLLAGTTPDYIQRVFKDDILNEGYASRSLFLVEFKDRKSVMFIPELNELQRQYEQDIIDHIKKLTELYGVLKVEKETEAWLEQWWARAQIERPNINERLQSYYARKKVHVIKLAMAIHFGESLEMTLGIDECRQAVEMLNAIEKRMHHALTANSKNPHYKLGLKMLEFLRGDGKRTLNELKAKFWSDASGQEPHKAIEQVVEHFLMVGKIGTNTDNGKTYYEVIREKQGEEISE